MILNNVSIFDLSPPEKLQLVEDLWDDLAATPSEVSVENRESVELGELKILFISRADLIRAKEASGRPQNPLLTPLIYCTISRLGFHRLVDNKMKIL